MHRNKKLIIIATAEQREGILIQYTEAYKEDLDLLVTKAALIRSIRSYTVPEEARVFLTDVNTKAEPKDGLVQMELLLQAR